VAAGACASARADPPPPEPARVLAGITVTLRIGESIAPEGLGATVTLLDVTNDSRCPADANCVWAGDATVTVRFETPDATAAVVALHTGLDDRRAATAAGLHLTLERLDPVPESARPTARSDYRAVVAVRK
jgi:hypothetical protein